MKINKKLLAKFGLGMFVAFILVMPVMASAEQLPAPTQIVQGNHQTIDLTTLEGWLTSIGRFVIAISMILAVIFIIWGGISYMLSRGDEGKAKKALAHVKNGIIGAAIVLGVGLILSTVQNLVQNGGGFFNK